MVIDPPACSNANQKKMVKKENTRMAIRRSRTTWLGVSSTSSTRATLRSGTPPILPKMAWLKKNCSAPRIMNTPARPKPRCQEIFSPM